MIPATSNMNESLMATGRATLPWLQCLNSAPVVNSSSNQPLSCSAPQTSPCRAQLLKTAPVAFSSSNQPRSCSAPQTSPCRAQLLKPAPVVFSSSNQPLSRQFLVWCLTKNLWFLVWCLTENPVSQHFLKQNASWFGKD